MDIKTKREREKQLVSQMIALYCRKKHGTRQSLCEACEQLAVYVVLRLDKCPFMEKKTFCSSCQTPCYAPAMREKIRQVMRFSGPRMLLVRPLTAFRHALTRGKGL